MEAGGRITTRRVERIPFAADLVERNFTPEGSDRLWVADITYLGSWERWMYLAFVLDAYSRNVVDPASNQGGIIADEANPNGMDFDSRESSEANQRPRLTVTVDATSSP